MRAAGFVIGVLGPVLVLLGPPAPAVASAVVVALVVASLVAVWFPDLGFPVIVVAQGLFLFAADRPATGPWPLALALGALVQAVAVMVSGTAPPGAALDPAVLRRWAARLGGMVLLAVTAEGLAVLASRLPTLPDPLGTVLAVTALLGLGAALLVLAPRLGRRGTRD